MEDSEKLLVEENVFESAKKLTGANYVKSKLPFFPTSPGVYRMISETGKVLYVGKAKNLRNRLDSYAHPERKPVRIQRMIFQIDHIELIETATEAEAFLLENDLIKKLKPYYNILLKDDKTFPHLLLTTKDEWPQLIKHRGGQNIKGEYFGPYASATAVNETLAILQKAFLLRSCADHVFQNRSRPCLLHQIKRCCAPCANKISKEDYQKLVDDVLDFMHGKSSKIQENLMIEMNEASEQLNYEKAAVLRDRIRALNQIQSQSMDLGGIENGDVVAVYQDAGQCSVVVFFYRNGRGCGSYASFPEQTEDQTDGEILKAFLGQFYIHHQVPKEILVNTEFDELELVGQAFRTKISAHGRGAKKRLVDRAVLNAKEALLQKRMQGMVRADLLEQLRQLVGASNPLKRIETYDNSHIQGTNAVGAMIVATPSGFDKKSYRKYNIVGIGYTPGDDFQMMDEVLTRRLKRGLVEGNLPDLILIDGGMIQLQIALNVLDRLQIKSIIAVGVAKGEDRNAGKETLYFKDKLPLNLEFDNPVLHYIQRLRDEAHRFVITTHRAKRNKSTLVSALDEIKGIGGKRKKALLTHFGSVQAIKSVSWEEISKVAGISEVLAKQIETALKS